MRPARVALHEIPMRFNVPGWFTPGVRRPAPGATATSEEGHQMAKAHAPGVQRILDAPVARELGRLATPNVLAVAMMTAVTFSDAWFVGQLGTAALASLALAFPFLTLMVMMAGGSIGGAATSSVARALGAGATLALTGLIGVGVAVVPGLWLDLFTADPGAYDFGVLYLTIAAPFYGLFGAGQALYFASQGTGRMVLPVTVSFVRFLTVAAIGALAAALGWGVAAMFVAVAVGLTLIGAGQALCLLGPGWREARPGGAKTHRRR